MEECKVLPRRSSHIAMAAAASASNKGQEVTYMLSRVHVMVVYLKTMVLNVVQWCSG